MGGGGGRGYYRTSGLANGDYLRKGESGGEDGQLGAAVLKIMKLNGKIVAIRRRIYKSGRCE